MGYYIETSGPKDKAVWLEAEHEAWILPIRPEGFEDIPEGQALICVLDNGPFEAAMLVVDREDFIELTNVPDEPGPDGELSTGPGGMPVYTLRSEAQERGDQRPRTWVMMEKTRAHQLAGYSG